MSTSDQVYRESYRRLFGEDAAPGKTSPGPGSRCAVSGKTINNEVVRDTNLSGGALLMACRFENVIFEQVNLEQATFLACRFRSCHFRDCNFGKAAFVGCRLRGVTFDGKRGRLERARFEKCRLSKVLFNDMHAVGVEFIRSRLAYCKFDAGKFGESKFLSNRLNRTTFHHCKMSDALFSRNYLKGCAFDAVLVDGIGAWSNRMDSVSRNSQNCLLGEKSAVHVHNLETSHFHSIVGNVGYSHLIDEMCEKCVLLLGRFTGENSETVRRLKDALHAEELLPIVFDFEGPKSRNLTETVCILAHMSKFVVADITDQKSVGHELQSIIPRLAVPVVPIIRGDAPVFALFYDYATADSVLDLVRFASLDALSLMIKDRIVEPARSRCKQIEEKRMRIAELRKIEERRA